MKIYKYALLQWFNYRTKRKIFSIGEISETTNHKLQIESLAENMLGNSVDELQTMIKWMQEAFEGPLYEVVDNNQLKILLNADELKTEIDKYKES